MWLFAPSSILRPIRLEFDSPFPQLICPTCIQALHHMLLLRTAIYPLYILIRAHHTHQPRLLLPRTSASWCTYKCPPTIHHSQYTPISAVRHTHTGAEAKATNKREPRARRRPTDTPSCNMQLGMQGTENYDFLTVGKDPVEFGEVNAPQPRLHVP